MNFVLAIMCYSYALCVAYKVLNESCNVVCTVCSIAHELCISVFTLSDLLKRT